MTDKTSREILDAIDFAVRETAVRATAGKLDVIAGTLAPVLYRQPAAQPAQGTRPLSSREILDAIDEALKETRRQLAEAEGAIAASRKTDGT